MPKGDIQARRGAPFSVMTSNRNRFPRRSHRNRTTIPEIFAVGLATAKEFGEAAEAAFLAKASALGFGVAKPWGDSARYDFILDSGRRFWRVQVKATAACRNSSRYAVRFSGSRNSYTCDEIDFLVVYIVPEDAWYVLPVEQCAGQSELRFNPRHPRTDITERYREAWCQMACSRRSRRPPLISLPELCRHPDSLSRRPYCPFHRSHP